MKRRSFIAQCFSVACVQTISAMPILGQQSLQTKVIVSLSRARLTRSTLRLEWKLTNISEEVLYVYATFLQGPSAMAPIVHDGVIKIRTSLNAPQPVGVNAYPPAKFSRLERDAPLTGIFTEHQVDGSIFRAATAVQMEVAFGKDVEEVKRQIAEAAGSDGHPANPIVAWQTEAVGKVPLSS